MMQLFAGPPITELWRIWNLNPWILVGLGLAAWLYTTGVRRLWRRAGVGRGLARSQVGCFYTGWAALALALVSPLDAAGHVLFSVHMVQHILLINVVAPLLVFGNAGYGWLWALPRALRPRLARWWRRRRFLQGVVGTITEPFVIWGIYAAVLWMWHIPAAYEAALQRESIHWLEHVSFTGSAALFWWHLLRPQRGPNASYASAILLVFTTMLHSGLLGALITFAPEPWYPNYVTNTAAWGISALADQQLAGVIMWVPVGLLYLVVTVTLLGRWLRHLERHEQPPARREGGAQLP